MGGLSSAVKLPKIQLALFLAIISISAMIFGKQPMAWITVPAILILTLGIDFILIRIRKIEPFLLSAAMVSGLIIGLLAFPSLPWYYFAAACALAMLSKNFLRLHNRHFFNPAAFGLLVTGWIFHENVSWWGVVFQGLRFEILALILFIILLLPSYVSIFRMKKTMSVLGFLLAYLFIQVALRSGQSNLWLTVYATALSPLVLFFALVMVPEPMTSPNNTKMQLLYGVFIGVLANFLNLIRGIFIPDTLILSLLVANFVFYWIRLKIP